MWIGENVAHSLCGRAIGIGTQFPDCAISLWMETRQTRVKEKRQFQRESGVETGKATSREHRALENSTLRCRGVHSVAVQGSPTI